MNTPTAEQKAVIDAPETHPIAVNAPPGTGKTSTLAARARQLPKRRILYLTPHKSAQREAERLVPENVKALTAHSLAYRAKGKPYRHKIGTLRPQHAVDVIQPDLPRSDALAYGLACVRALNTFLTSAAQEPNEHHLPSDSVEEKGFDPEVMTRDVARLWAAVIDPRSTYVPMPHDGYLKLFQREHPDLSWRFDAVYLDDAQDVTPAVFDLFERQRTLHRIAVGDPTQAISFSALTMDLLRTWHAAEHYRLTKSFRFGPAIAGVFNALVEHELGERPGLEGCGGPCEVRNHLASRLRGHACYLHRTNAAVFSRAVQLLQLGAPIHWAGGIQSYQLELLRDTYHLAQGDRSRVRDTFLRRFHSLEGLGAYADATQDLEIKARVAVVSHYGRYIPSLLDALYRRADPCGDAPLVVATPHKAKGSSWPVVVMGEDFVPRPEPQAGTATMDAKEGALLCVAATRASTLLVVSPSIWDLVHTEGAATSLAAPLVA